jgi:2-polyprenyl-3-methyl-5-hydroxy-6-metoxy-1,4-benzoquinol methylase
MPEPQMNHSSRLADCVELMDTGLYHPAEITSNLADLRLFNLRFGGVRVMRRAIARLLPRDGAARDVTLLDVGTGSADIPAALLRWLDRSGIPARAHALDFKEDILEEARRYIGANAPALSLMQGEAERLPCRDRSVDFVVSSTFMHHLEQEQARLALAEMRRVARRGVIVVDLRRGAIAFWLVWLLTRITSRNRITRHDGPLSVRRAYVPGELRALAEAAGMRGASVRAAGPVRMILTWSP